MEAYTKQSVEDTMLETYPFNLAYSILRNREDVMKIYLPGIYDALATLTERETNILEKRFLGKMSLKGCGELYGITRERIRQIEAKAIRKLRHPSKVKLFIGVPLVELQDAQEEYQKLLREHEMLTKAFEQRPTKDPDNNRILVATGRLIATMQTPISDLDLSTRSYNCLRRAGVETIRDIVEMTDNELCRIRNLGRKCQEEIKSMLREYGLELRK